ncbi:Sugar transferase involved in LPS biosynthesis (colanic, teichoic acid) [Roseovarius pacificus]|uniref:Sugar transferase involved in LPS biosynthesis (Colanic, teichoic acid) n=2 Tax=Roseovarius pacificus TaxID=337701 RepID=A0A1M7HMT8_9RHOB|nr:sugar transferase [Roseovarius pacificus]SHM29842.1 Sugar transferase involved in LPS biosynthesis (colanic, teichoic acid) [Roseovarius pacificus]
MTIQDKDISKNFNAIPVQPRIVISGRRTHRSFSPYSRIFKRVLDLVLVIAAMPIVVPMILLLAFLVALDGHNPFYSQKRVGRNGREFRMWKLRSMVHDAEARLQNHLETNVEARAEWNSKQKLAHDPRITRLGRVLRKSSLDELPQLLNVLTGDMSLVGPRPMMPEQRQMYPGVAYFDMRPGVTGYWQISDRNQTSFAARASFDVRYYNDMSLGTDLKVLTQTVGVVLRGTGC